MDASWKCLLGKSGLSALGLVGLALYQTFNQHDYNAAMQSVMAALAIVGLRHGIEKKKS